MAKFAHSLFTQALIAVGLTAGLTTTAFAIQSTSGPFINGFVGVAHITTNNNGINYPGTPVETDVLVDSEDSTNRFVPGIGVGYDFVLHPAKTGNYIIHDVSFALNYYHTSFSPSGDVYAYGSPSLDDYTYDMKVNSDRVMYDSEWNFHPMWGGAQLFAEAGIGAAYNTVKVSETAIPPVDPDSTTSLSKNGHTNLAYEFGGGIKVPLSQHLEASARYLYTNLGYAESENTGTLGSGDSVDLDTPLKVNLRSQSCMVGLAYQFG
jgi:opacity protein-like surface antigen